MKRNPRREVAPRGDIRESRRKVRELQRIFDTRKGKFVGSVARFARADRTLQTGDALGRADFDRLRGRIGFDREVSGRVARNGDGSGHRVEFAQVEKRPGGARSVRSLVRSLVRGFKRRLHAGAHPGRKRSKNRFVRHFPAARECTKRFRRRRAKVERFETRDGQLAIVLDRDELSRFVKEGETLAEVFADLPLHLVGATLDFVEASELGDPLGGRFFTALFNPGDVVDLVAHEREVVDDALGRNAVLFNHAVSVVELGVHRVEKRHVLVDELRHVLVARRDDDFHPFGSSFPGKRRNNVVGFDTGHDEKRPPEIGENLLKGLDLHAQIVGHRRTIRLVLGIHRVTEILPGRVENDERTIGLHHALDAPEHAEKTPHGARRFAVRRGERRQAVVGTEKIVRSVNE